MKEIIELSNRVIAEAPDVIPKDFWAFWLGRKQNVAKILAALPASIQAEAAALQGRLNEVIPDDFNYDICFGDNQPTLLVSYNDGAQTSAGCRFDWNPCLSIIEQLKAINWEDERTWVLAQCQTFDDLLEEATHRPATLPSTKELQKDFQKELQAFVKSKQNDDGKVHLLMYREDNGLNPEFGFQEESFDTLKQIPGELIDLMAVQYWVITIVANGKPLSTTKIDELKSLALHDMKEHMPISYAKATGRF
jgi:hypothetical protein